MSKTTIIGTHKQINPIVFTDTLVGSSFESTQLKPSRFENIELIAKEHYKSYDLMFAYDTDRSEGQLFYGKWNDGIVE